VPVGRAGGGSAPVPKSMLMGGKALICSRMSDGDVGTDCVPKQQQQQQHPRQPASKPEVRLRELVQQLFHKCPAALTFRLSFGSQLGVGDIGVLQLAKRLQRFDNLLSVDLGSQKVGDVGCAALMACLQRHVGLRSLQLEDNQISNKGCFAIAAAIRGSAHRRLSRLTHVDLSYNKISDDGCLALAEAVAHAPLLLAFHTHANSIGDEAVAVLHAALCRSCPAIEDCDRLVMDSTQEQWPFHKAEP
jgi:hypothetical protein